MKINELSLAQMAVNLAKVGEALGIPNLDPTSGTIFLTSAAGPVGHRVATRLLNASYPKLRIGVVQLTENATEFELLNKQGAELADFDWMDETTYVKALVGVKSVFCAAPHIRRWNHKFPVFLKACEQAGVKHFVKISFYHARKSGDVFQDVPFVKAHGDCDEWLACGRFAISYTILSASHLMSAPLTSQEHYLRSERKLAIYGSSAGKGINYVSPNDVAEVAVRVLFCPKDHHNKEYTLVGPTAISDQEVSGLLSEHLEKPITFVDQPLQNFRKEEMMGGNPAWLVEDVVAMEKVKATGQEELMTFTSDDIDKICGHSPEDYEEYLQRKDFMSASEVCSEQYRPQQ
jgi:NAD(P)H dehydrogenase (quinone)